MRSRNQNMSKMWCLLGCDALINGSKNQWTQSIDKEQKPEQEWDAVFASVWCECIDVEQKPEQEQDAVFARVWCTYQWFQELMGTNEEIMQL